MLFNKKNAADVARMDDRLFINKGSRLTGTMDSPSHIVIAGEFEGTINTKTLEVTESGAVKGIINTEAATVSGMVNATMKCTGQLKITATGNVTGDIEYGTLEVVLGGVSVGNIEQTANMRIVRPQINLANITDKR